MSLPHAIDVDDVAIVGAGAAGLATAIFARQPWRRARAAAGQEDASTAVAGPTVRLFDGARKPGAKILVSGGSRCNVSNVAVSERDFWTSGSHAVIRRVLRALPVPMTIAWFREMGVTLHEEEFGKLFPDSNRARDVLEALLRTATDSGIRLCVDARVLAVRRSPDGLFVLETNRGDHRARKVVLATGGRALPRSGSDGGGYELAAALGHRIVPTTPALVPLLLDGRFHTRLSGVSQVVDLAVWVGGRLAIRVSGPLLWTHFGISGPAALNASRHIERARLEQRQVRVTVGFLPGLTFERADARLTSCGTDRPKLSTAAALAQWLPGSVADALLEAAELPSTLPLARLTRVDRRRLAHALVEWELPVTGSRGYTFAEATAGGVDLSEVDPATLESRRCHGLYLVGELLDVDGRLGGFNFQWAWASGRVAGAALAQERS